MHKCLQETSKGGGRMARTSSSMLSDQKHTMPDDDKNSTCSREQTADGWQQNEDADLRELQTEITLTSFD